jgi:hypothetical protein
VIGIVAPEDSVFVEGLPGCSSTNQLPSRKSRGRIFSVASAWIGRPFDFHAHQAGCALATDRADLADIHPGDAHRRAGSNVDGRRKDRLQAIASFERHALGEAEVHGDHHDYEEYDPDAQRVVPLHLDDRQFVAAAAQAQAAHFRFPFFAFFFVFFFTGSFASPRSFSVALEYVCPNRSCSRVVASWVVPVAPGAWPITVWPCA